MWIFVFPHAEKNEIKDDLDDDDDDDEDEDEDIMKKETPSSVQRVGILTNKLRKRIHKKALLNIRYAQTRSQETIEKLHFTVDLVSGCQGNAFYLSPPPPNFAHRNA